MTDKRRKRDLNKEQKYLMFWDIVMLLAVALPLSILTPKIGRVGDRNLIILALGYGFIVQILMIVFEKYKPNAESLWEMNVISVLSNGMSYCVLVLIDLIFFQSMRLFVVSSVLAGASLVSLIIENILFYLYCNSEKRFRKARLLIIDTNEKNFGRMKRIKYGITSMYDTWYEVIETDSEQQVREFAQREFPKFDSICILDGLSDVEYNVAVKSALELDKELFIVPKMMDINKCCATLTRFDDVLTLYIPEYSLNVVETAMKRTFDIILSLVGTVVAAIPMLIIALAIKLTDRGPVFYKQTRYTKDKKEFQIYKFRTMIVDAEKYTGAVFAQKDDPRITKVGKLLRAMRLDELPQLLNILKGDMSIVGPRPERPVFVEQFEKEVEHYDYRFRVKAGLTALSHVYGRYSTYIHDRTCYDLYYIANYSFLMDMKIVLLTAKTMFLKSAAEGEDQYKTKTRANKDSNESDEVTKVEK